MKPLQETNNHDLTSKAATSEDLIGQFGLELKENISSYKYLKCPLSCRLISQHDIDATSVADPVSLKKSRALSPLFPRARLSIPHRRRGAGPVVMDCTVVCLHGTGASVGHRRRVSPMGSATEWRRRRLVAPLRCSKMYVPGNHFPSPTCSVSLESVR